MKMSPFVKWAGGKRQLLDRLTMAMPAKYNRYFEPFIGGGSLFLDRQPKKAVINDSNEQLIQVYRQIQQDASSLIRCVRQLDEMPCDKERYLAARKTYNEKIIQKETDVESAALLIWLNKHCYNGLYRVNLKGMFNVPYNNKTSGTSIDEENVRNIEKYLQENDIEIRQGDFGVACQDALPGDFVFFDSPYAPLSATANFTSYSKDGFSLTDHKRLAELYRKLSDAGVLLLLTNHNTPWIRELYHGFEIQEYDVRRAINRDASKRFGTEIQITNYKAQDRT